MIFKWRHNFWIIKPIGSIGSYCQAKLQCVCVSDLAAQSGRPNLSHMVAHLVPYLPYLVAHLELGCGLLLIELQHQANNQGQWFQHWWIGLVKLQDKVHSKTVGGPPSQDFGLTKCQACTGMVVALVDTIPAWWCWVVHWPNFKLW